MPELDLSVYLVTDRGFCSPGRFLEILEACLDAGVTCVQVREKSGPRQLYQTALAVRDLVRPQGIPFMVNDRLDVAMAVDADGVHLGQGDLPAGLARAVWKRPFYLGVSVSTVEEAQAALADGADHLGVGALFPTSTKTDAGLVSLDELRRICASVPLAVAGIGGIHPGNAHLVRAAGAKGLAVVSAVWAAEDPARVVRQLAGMPKCQSGH